MLVAGDYVVVLEAMVQDGYGTATQPAGTAAGDLIRFHVVDEVALMVTRVYLPYLMKHHSIEEYIFFP